MLFSIKALITGTAASRRTRIAGPRICSSITSTAKDPMPRRRSTIARAGQGRLQLCLMDSETFTKQAARAAYGWGRPQSWQDAIALLTKAAGAGEPDAAQQLRLVTQTSIDLLLTPPGVERMSSISLIGACRGFAPPGFSEWLIERTKDRLVAASVNTPDGAPAVRTARDAAFGPRQRDLVLAIMQERAARLMSVAVERHEPPNVISYEPGEEFGLHVDYIDPNVPQYQAELQQLGQRTATIVTYLNEDFEGAETHVSGCRSEVPRRYRRRHRFRQRAARRPAGL